MMHIKITQVGNSAALILPKDVMAQLKARKGDVLTVSILPDGVKLSAYNPDVAEQVELGRDIARDYRDTLRALSK